METFLEHLVNSSTIPKYFRDPGLSLYFMSGLLKIVYFNAKKVQSRDISKINILVLQKGKFHECQTCVLLASMKKSLKRHQFLLKCLAVMDLKVESN